MPSEERRCLLSFSSASPCSGSVVSVSNNSVPLVSKDFRFLVFLLEYGYEQNFRVPVPQDSLQLF
jgi:hypothetical protein